MNTGSTIRIALPWLHEAVGQSRAAGTLPPLPALAWIVGRGSIVPTPLDDWRTWLIGAVDAHVADTLRRWPAGPCLAAARAIDGAVSGWAVAQPVHLATGMDHLRMAPLAEAAPSPAEVAQLEATLRQYFAEGGRIDLAGYNDGAWLVRCHDTFDCATHDPAMIVGRNIHEYMPSGPDGARVRSLMNEIQMLLHEHPVNVRRDATRALPINALWLWGFGAVEQPAQTLARLAGWKLQGDDVWLRAFWRSHGGQERPLGEAGTTAGGDALVAMTQPPTSDAAESLVEVDSSLFVRLARAVQAGALHRLELYDGARVLALDPHSRWRLWRRPAVADRL